MSTNSAASQLSPALREAITDRIDWSFRLKLSWTLKIAARDELVVSEFLRDLGADIDGDSEADGPDTIRCTGKGWTLVLKVN